MDINNLKSEEVKAFDTATEGLDEAVKKILKLVLKENAEFYVVQDGYGLEIHLDLGACPAECKLCFTGGAVKPAELVGYMYSEGLELEKRGEEYVMSGEVLVWGNDEITPFELRFKGAKAEVRPYKATSGVFFSIGSPWENLSAMARNICAKKKLFGDGYLNEKEKELLPLIEELGNLGLFYEKEFPLFKNLLRERGYAKPLRYLEDMENPDFKDKRREGACKELIHTLGGHAYEGLWRELYLRITETQNDYPELINEDTLSRAKKLISKELYALGYVGEYPNFVKRDKIKGLHHQTGYGTSCFVTPGEAVFHIRCSVFGQDGEGGVYFLCGMEKPKKGEKHGDIYSCMFREGGKRFRKAHFFCGNIKEANTVDRLKTACAAVDKSVRLEKLSKEERKTIGDTSGKALPFFLALYAAAGLLFGLCMTAVSMITAASEAGSLSVLADKHWLFEFLAQSVGFGVLFGLAMTIVIHFENRQ